MIYQAHARASYYLKEKREWETPKPPSSSNEGCIASFFNKVDSLYQHIFSCLLSMVITAGSERVPEQQHDFAALPLVFPCQCSGWDTKKTRCHSCSRMPMSPSCPVASGHTTGSESRGDFIVQHLIGYWKCNYIACATLIYVTLYVNRQIPITDNSDPAQHLHHT